MKIEMKIPSLITIPHYPRHTPARLIPPPKQNKTSLINPKVPAIPPRLSFHKFPHPLPSHILHNLHNKSLHTPLRILPHTPSTDLGNRPKFLSLNALIQKVPKNNFCIIYKTCTIFTSHVLFLHIYCLKTIQEFTKFR
jgi:hypothetical protein